jgi:hypothetical protein
MKIISKYNDYYDSIMRMGYDDNIVFIRKGWENDSTSYNTHDIIDKRWKRINFESFDDISKVFYNHINQEYIKYFPVKKTNSLWRTTKFLKKSLGETYNKTRGYELESISPILLGFCGRFFVIYKIEIRIKGKQRLLYKDYFITNDDHKVFKIKNEKGTFKPVIGEVDDFFVGNINEIFLTLKAPIFAIDFGDKEFPHTHWLYVNPVLKQFNFEKLIDPYTAYQELSMFLGSLFVNDDDNMVTISDENKAISKGFDEWSFKKPPSKNKINR